MTTPLAIPEGSTVLDYLRHAWKAKQKGDDGQTHIDTSKRDAIVAYGERIDDSLLGFRIDVAFYGAEIRTRETVDALIEGARRQIATVGPIDEIGDETFAYGVMYTPAVLERVKAGRKDYIALLIEEHGLEAVRAWALYGLGGVFKMLASIRTGERGIAVGHSPDFTMLAMWAALGFPPIDTLPNGGTNLKELTGSRFILTPSRQLIVQVLDLHTA